LNAYASDFERKTTAFSSAQLTFLFFIAKGHMHCVLKELTLETEDHLRAQASSDTLPKKLLP
jgi:hypothetical protein